MLLASPHIWGLYAYLIQVPQCLCFTLTVSLACSSIDSLSFFYTKQVRPWNCVVLLLTYIQQSPRASWSIQQGQPATTIRQKRHTSTNWTILSVPYISTGTSTSYASLSSNVGLHVIRCWCGKSRSVWQPQTAFLLSGGVLQLDRQG